VTDEEVNAFMDESRKISVTFGKPALSTA